MRHTRLESANTIEVLCKKLHHTRSSLASSPCMSLEPIPVWPSDNNDRAFQTPESASEVGFKSIGSSTYGSAQLSKSRDPLNRNILAEIENYFTGHRELGREGNLHSPRHISKFKQQLVLSPHTIFTAKSIDRAQ